MTMRQCFLYPPHQNNAALRRRTRRRFSSSSSSANPATTSTSATSTPKISAIPASCWSLQAIIITVLVIILVLPTNFTHKYAASAFGGTANNSNNVRGGETSQQWQNWLSSPASSCQHRSRTLLQKLQHYQQYPKYYDTSSARGIFSVNNANGDDDYYTTDRYDPDVAAQLRRARQLLNDVAMKKERMNTNAGSEKESLISTNARTGRDIMSTTSLSNPSSSIPYFATTQAPSLSLSTMTAATTTTASITNPQKIKSKTQSGSIIADGESMALLSKSEPWEIRSLSQMKFREEVNLDYDGNIPPSDSIAPLSNTDDYENDGSSDVEGEDCSRNISNDIGSTKSSSTLADRDVASSIYNLRKILRNEDFMQVFDSRNRFIGELD